MSTVDGLPEAWKYCHMYQGRFAMSLADLSQLWKTGHCYRRFVKVYIYIDRFVIAKDVGKKVCLFCGGRFVTATEGFVLSMVDGLPQLW